jgi:hypothetical protein
MNIGLSRHDKTNLQKKTQQTRNDLVHTHFPHSLHRRLEFILHRTIMASKQHKPATKTNQQHAYKARRSRINYDSARRTNNSKLAFGLLRCFWRFRAVFTLDA